MARLKTMLFAGALIGVTACSVKQGLDTDRVEAFITTELAEQTGIEPTRVECPDDVYEDQGKTFECRAFADDGGSARVIVTMLGDGKVTFRVPN